MILPNGLKVLESLGYDRVRAGAVPILGFLAYDKQGNLHADVPVDTKAYFGADSLAQKRSDLRDELMRLATAPAAELGISGEPAEVVFNNEVVGLDQESGVVTLIDGSTTKGDVVIGE